jgi:NodT family efflux transporter outer membrane factor (OMF) lipoprotein
MLVFTGCAVLPTFGTARKQGDLAAFEKTVPAKWSVPVVATPGAATGWLDDFSSARLKSLVQTAIASNPDLRAAAARVEQARAQIRVAGAEALPQLGAGFDGSRSQRASGQRFVGIGTRSNRFNLQADVSWELDFWGRIRDQRGAAASDAETAQADEHAARLSLAANTAKAAISLAESGELIALAEDNIKTRRTHLDLLERQLDRGLDAEKIALDVSLSRADLARAEASLASRKRERDAARRALENLLGAYPAGQEGGIGPLPILRRSVPASVPSDLLLRRPDLISAERRLHAALQRESVAKKAFLPSFSLTGDTGFSTEEFVRLLEREAFIWSLAGSVAQTIFQGGRLKANVDLARARYDEALAEYASAALTAFKEVETALAAESWLREQESALERAVTEADRSRKLAVGQYERGLADALTLLDAQQRFFDAQSALVTVKALRLNRVDLHLGLGGKFD